MGIAPLSPNAFADALRKGQGRVWQHVRDHGDAGVEACLRDAIVHGVSYDPQIEGHRSGWLMDLLGLLADPLPYHRLIEAAFASATASADLDRLASMVGILAEGGNETAGALLRTRVAQLPADQVEDVGVHLVAIDGLPAFLQLASQIGDAASIGGSSWLQLYAEQTFGDEVVRDALAGSNDRRVMAYAARIATDREPSAPRARVPWDAFLASLATAPRRRHRSLALRFARNADESDLISLIEGIEAGLHPEALLHAAHHAELPRQPRNLTELAASTDRLIAEAAVAALVQFRTADVLAFGRQRVAAGHWSAIPLLAGAGDAEVAALADVLPLHDDSEVLHRLGMDLRNLCEDRSADIAPVLLWLVETTPCAFCRHGAIRNLISLSALPQAVADEAEHDSYEETCDLISALGTGSVPSDDWL